MSTILLILALWLAANVAFVLARVWAVRGRSGVEGRR